MSVHPFITTTVTSREYENIATAKNNTIYMIGTKGSGTIGNNEIKSVPTLADFDTIVGSDAASRPAYRFMRLIDGAVPVYFVNGFDEGATPALVDHLVQGTVVLGGNVQLLPGILVIPETSGLSAGDIATVFTAAETLVSNALMNWEYYHNLTAASNTAALAITEASSLSSPQGHSAAFWGYGKDANDDDVPLAVVAAARTTLLNRTRTGYFSPAAFQEPIPFKSVPAEFIPAWSISADEYTTLNDKNINTVFLNGDGINVSVYTLNGARTLAANDTWRYMNTRYAANDIFFRTAITLKPFLFLPSDINPVIETPTLTQTVRNSDVILALQVLMATINREGAFSEPPIQNDGIRPQKYTINPERLSDGNLSITIEMFLVQSREKIDLSFIKRG